jgi:pyrimidine operon attenuation protein/uracil phosphoribosyltransferase
MAPAILFNSEQVESALKVMGAKIHEEFKQETSFLIVGIQSGGLNVAKHLKTILEDLGTKGGLLGSVDTTLYRDDLHRISPGKGLMPMDLPASVEEAAILLVDDVIYTGRSARAAMDALFCLGRPRKIRLAVLVDRGHRELPVQPDYQGFNIKTAYEDEVNVTWEGLIGQVELLRRSA